MNALSISFTELTLVVRDMKASLAFYRALGMTIPDATIWPKPENGHHVSIALAGGIRMALDSAAMTRSFDPNLPTGPLPSTNAFVFSVASREEVETLYGAMTSAGYAGRLAPFDAFWGARYAVIDYPDGNHVGIMGPVDKKAAFMPSTLQDHK